MAKTPSLPIVQDDDQFEETDENGNLPDEFQVPDENSDDSSEDFRAKLVGKSFDEAQHEKLRREMLMPPGDYEKDEIWDYSNAKNVKIWSDDKQPGDFNPKGRMVFTLWGYPKTRYDRDHNDFRPFLRFSVSMDVRFHRDPEKAEKGMKDLTTRLWTEAEEAFINVKERMPNNALEVLDFLVEEDYVMNTMNGDSGLIVLHIKAPRKKSR